jgi:hypothetical protein
LALLLVSMDGLPLGLQVTGFAGQDTQLSRSPPPSTISWLKRVSQHWTPDALPGNDDVAQL